MESCRRRSSSAPASAVPKLERKDVEKNRRNNMKNLCNQLYSLLPLHTSQETIIALPDQIDAAEKYIKSSEMKLEKNKMYLEELRRMSSRKRPKLSNSTNKPDPSTKSSPQIQVHEMGPNVDMILITDLDNLTTFNNIIRLFHEEGVEIMSTSFTLHGNSMLQISHKTKINRSCTVESRTTTLCDKLKELLYGKCHGSDDLESELNLWDYIVESHQLIGGYYDVQLLPTTQNPNT
ncbi:hypothetical protein HAX54_042183 [Datura stramonium]|uniref:BHLH domain-containing protein n=1 Tax=Datura stramonium TaxID=4076 RepID=A0ABS8W232_DATST|nr:hypothetical protein [Datura stramonium]